jgi:hypothetical protein
VERRFDAIVLMPIAIVLGLALGLQLSTGQFPVELISQTISLVLGVWIAIIVVEMIVRMVFDAVLNLAYHEPDWDKEETPVGQKGELTVLLIRGDEVVGQLKSWDQIKDVKRRGALTNKLRRLLARQQLVGGKVEQ